MKQFMTSIKRFVSRNLVFSGLFPILILLTLSLLFYESKTELVTDTIDVTLEERLLNDATQERNELYLINDEHKRTLESINEVAARGASVASSNQGGSYNEIYQALSECYELFSEIQYLTE